LPACCHQHATAQAPGAGAWDGIVGITWALAALCAVTVLVRRRARRRAVKVLLREMETRGGVGDTDSARAASHLRRRAMLLRCGDPLRVRALSLVSRARAQKRSALEAELQREVEEEHKHERSVYAKLHVLTSHVSALSTPQACASGGSASGEIPLLQLVGGLDAGHHAAAQRAQVLITAELAPPAPKGLMVGVMATGHTTEGSGTPPPQRLNAGGFDEGSGLARLPAGESVGGDPSLQHVWHELHATARLAHELRSRRAELTAEKATLTDLLSESQHTDSVARIRDELSDKGYSREEAAAQATPIWTSRREEWTRRAAGIHKELDELARHETESRTDLARQQEVALQFIAAARQLRRQRTKDAEARRDAALRADGQRDEAGDARDAELAIMWDLAWAELATVACVWAVSVLDVQVLLEAMPGLSYLRPRDCVDQALESPVRGWTPSLWSVATSVTSMLAPLSTADGLFSGDVYRCVVQPLLVTPAAAILVAYLFPEAAARLVACGLVGTSVWTSIVVQSPHARLAMCVWALYHISAYAFVWLERFPTERYRRLSFRLCHLVFSAVLCMRVVWAPRRVQAVSLAWFGCDSAASCTMTLSGHLARDWLMASIGQAGLAGTPPR